MKPLLATSIALFVLMMAGTMGCSRGGPTTYSVSGRITYAEKPVAGAQVGFVPVDSDNVKPARGETDTDGYYTVKTYLGPGDEARGAMAGKFKVTVEKSLPQKQIVSYDDLKNRKAEIPLRYADTSKTPLTADVSADGANTFDFTLEDAPSSK